MSAIGIPCLIRKGIPVIAILGPDEVAQGQVNLKRLSDGEEQTVARADVAQHIQDLFS